MATKDQIKIIHTLLPDEARHDRDLKQELVRQFTEDDSRTSTTQLTQKEADNLIHFLTTGESVNNASFGLFDRNNKQHRYILSLCQMMPMAIERGWAVPHAKYRMVANTTKLGEWLSSPKSPVRKPLKQMNSNELHKVIYALERMLAKGIAE